MISRDKFKSKEFNEIDFYLSVKDLDLELIQDELKCIQAQVLEQVQEYVNQEYLNFLSLSRDLDFVDEELVDYAKELYKILDRVKAFDQNLQNSSLQALNVLKTSSDLRVQKEISKYDALMAQMHVIKDEMAIDLLKGIVLYKEIQDFEAFSVNLPKVNTGLEQVKELLRNEMDAQLKNMFLQNFKDGHDQAQEFVKLCTGVTLLDCFDLLASCFRNGVIDKWISSSLSLSRFQVLTCLQGGQEVEHEENIMGLWLAEFLEFLQKDVLWFVRLTDGMFLGREFSLLTDAVWPALVHHVDKMTSIKNPAHLKDFHCNYLAIMKFIKDFETLYSDSDQQVRFKSQESFAEFIKMWQLPEIQQEMENSLVLETVQVKQELSIKASQALINGIESLWAPHVFLYGLQYRALKATFNFISIYRTIISDLLKEDTRDASKSEDTFITLLLTLSNDLELLNTHLLSLAKSWPIPENLRDQTLNQVEKSWKEESMLIQTEIQSNILNLIFIKCNEVIKQVRIIPSQFRGTQKDTPTKPSVFLPGILAPITNFKKMHHSRLVSEISQKITAQVITRYEDTVTETLNSVSNIEAGLKRFKRTKNVSEVSDEDKIRRQLEIDAQEFKRLVEKG